MSENRMEDFFDSHCRSNCVLNDTHNALGLTVFQQYANRPNWLHYTLRLYETWHHTHQGQYDTIRYKSLTWTRKLSVVSLI